nr:PhnD/SsuA/transferrin family substrate-binding protein [Mariprofundus sp. NF]
MLSSTAWAEHYKVGILAFQPRAEAMQRWQPLADYLHQQIPEHSFEVLPLNYSALDQAIKERKIDFLLTNPGHYVRLLHYHLVNRALATQVNRIAGEEVAVFGGVIFTLAERSDISNLQSLAGRSIASVDQGSLGGFQMQAYALYEAGIETDELKMLWTEMPHDRVVEKVLQREADAGFVRTGVLERLIRNGTVDARQIKIINRQNLTGFPLHASTHLYPEWPFTALSHMQEGVIREVTGALLTLPHDGPVVQQMRLHGFNVAADYEPVRDILRDLRLPPYTEIPGYYWSYLWEDYRWYIVTGAVVIVVILLLLVLLRLANRGLQESETRYRTLVQNIPGATYRCNNDRDWSMSFISSEIESITGYATADFLNNSVRSYASIIHPDDQAMVKQRVAEGIEKCQPYTMEYRILNSRGEIRGSMRRGRRFLMIPVR